MSMIDKVKDFSKTFSIKKEDAMQRRVDEKAAKRLAEIDQQEDTDLNKILDQLKRINEHK